MSNLREKYTSEVAPALMKQFNYKSVMQIPKIEKVVVNVGCSEAKDNSKVIDSVISDIEQITGQHPIVCKAKKSVHGWLRHRFPCIHPRSAPVPWNS